MPAPFRFEGHWLFPVGAGELWSALGRTDEFQRWWPWLRTFDSGGLVQGSVSHCVVRAPVPYSLDFSVTIVEMVPERSLATRVGGDLEGPARLDVADRAGGSEARLRWELELRDPLLRAMSAMGRPVMEWAHDRVVDSGVRRFRRLALPRPGP